MPSSLFGPNSTIPVTPQETPSNSKPVEDPISIAEQEILQSGGDAKAAFYSLAKKKGVNPDQFLKQINGMGNPSQLLTQMMTKNSRIGSLLRLFSGMK